jgi:steroid delta-isomerase-like uncharacterized protein
MTDPRIDIVNEHLRLENAYDFPGCIAVFGSPRYEVMAGSEMFDGADQVHSFLRENHKAFPDFQFAPVRILPTTNAVIVEGRFTGTHLGTWRGLPATGRKIDFAMCLIFDFDGESLISERLYFDQGAPLRQLGIADDPNSVRGKATMVITHPLVILKALLRGIIHR